MATISRSRSRRETGAIAVRLRQTERDDREAYAEVLSEAVRHPCAHHVWRLDHLWHELALARAALGDHDRAIQAQWTAIEHGLSTRPDPRADIADWHLQAGRRGGADRLFGRLRGEFPGDPWLYANAGLSYLEAEDHSTAMRWLTAGLELAMEQGDPDRIVDRLDQLRRHCVTALGGDPDDDLAGRAEAFEPTAPRRAPRDVGAGNGVREDPTGRPCEHCGYEPEPRSA